MSNAYFNAIVVDMLDSESEEGEAGTIKEMLRIANTEIEVDILED
jgi:hypothetical protein